MGNEKNEYLERLKKYNEGKTRIQGQNRRNEEKISEEIIRNSELNDKDRSDDNSGDR